MLWHWERRGGALGTSGCKREKSETLQARAGGRRATRISATLPPPRLGRSLGASGPMCSVVARARVRRAAESCCGRAAAPARSCSCFRATSAGWSYSSGLGSVDDEQTKCARGTQASWRDVAGRGGQAWVAGAHLRKWRAGAECVSRGTWPPATASAGWRQCTASVAAACRHVHPSLTGPALWAGRTAGTPHGAAPFILTVRIGGACQAGSTL